MTSLDQSDGRGFQPRVLEIHVRITHGATVGRLDEEALFYMRTRGVPEKDAKVLQMLSFLSPVTPEDKREIVEKAVLQLV